MKRSEKLSGTYLLLWVLVVPPVSVTALGAEDPSNVVLITIDTLRADYVGIYGGPVETPVLDGLARDGVHFRTVYCQVPLTPPSHASILTGTRPATHGLRDFTSGPLAPGSVTMARILRDNGYGTAAFVSALVLDSVWALDQGFDLYYDDFDEIEADGGNPGNVQRRAEDTIDRVLDWQEGSSKPFFLWVHLFDPHHDYDAPEPFGTRYRSDPYGGEVAYVDEQVGRLVTALKEAGVYEDSVIIATSDHGESLGEHGEPNHGLFLYETTTRIPLIVKMPARYDVKGREVATLVQSIDILPSLLQILRIPIKREWGIEGRGRLAAILGKEDRRGHGYAESLYARNTFGWSPLFALREGRYKFIEAPRPELYDLDQDPGEEKNLYSAQNALGEQLRSRLAHLKTSSRTSTQTGSKADPKTIESLSALGYVAVSQPVPVQSEESLADPKDKLPVYQEIVRGLTAAESGRLDLSNRILVGVAEANPELFIVHYSIGTNFLKLGRFAEALDALDRAKVLNPDFESIDFNRALALASLNKPAEAIDILRSVVQKNSSFQAAHHRLASLYRRTGKPALAVQEYRSILQKRPDDFLATKLLGISLIDAREYAAGLDQLGRLESAQEDALTRNYRGIALANLGRLSEASESYRAALELKPDYHQARLNLAFALLRNGDREGARKEYDALCETNKPLCEQYRDRFVARDQN